ncbi:MAG: Transposase family protein [Gemmataceae bacterium]|nr:Transposase family protein [Gemmataceae bacterium]
MRAAGAPCPRSVSPGHDGSESPIASPHRHDRYRSRTVLVERGECRGVSACGRAETARRSVGAGGPSHPRVDLRGGAAAPVTTSIRILVVTGSGTGGLPNYVGDAASPYLVFDLSVDRPRDAPAAVLKAYTGFVHADGSTGYNPVCEGGVTHVGCRMPARRYFLDARVSDPERAHEARARIRALYPRAG